MDQDPEVRKKIDKFDYIKIKNTISKVKKDKQQTRVKIATHIAQT